MQLVHTMTHSLLYSARVRSMVCQTYSHFNTACSFYGDAPNALADLQWQQITLRGEQKGRYDHSATVFGNDIYIAGGRANDDNALNEILILNTSISELLMQHANSVREFSSTDCFSTRIRPLDIWSRCCQHWHTALSLWRLRRKHVDRADDRVRYWYVSVKLLI